MNINDLRDDVTTWSIEKGWHEGWELGTKLLLVTSEIAEAHEEIRNRHQPGEIYYSPGDKPEGMPIELADAVIRIADIAGYYGIDLDEAIRIKMLYNQTRPYRHGGKTA